MEELLLRCSQPRADIEVQLHSTLHRSRTVQQLPKALFAGVRRLLTVGITCPMQTFVGPFEAEKLVYSIRCCTIAEVSYHHTFDNFRVDHTVHRSTARAAGQS